MSATESLSRKPSTLERVLVNGAIVVALVYTLYPILWVVSLALSKGASPEARVLPWPTNPSLDNFRIVTGAGDPERSWLFGRQLVNSLVVSFATAATAVAIATPAAYALARFEFVGKRSGMRTLLMTQMFPGVASAVPLYLILDWLHLLDTRSGLVLVYAATAVPFAIFSPVANGMSRFSLKSVTRTGALSRSMRSASGPCLSATPFMLTVAFELTTKLSEYFRTPPPPTITSTAPRAGV